MAGRITYTVKEYDYLLPKTGLKYVSLLDENAVVLSDSDYDELVKYLLSSVKDEGKQLFRAIKFSGNSRYGQALQLKNYVGMIELPKSRNRVEILPKIYSGTTEVSDINDIKRILLSMLSSLKDFPVLDLGNAFIDIRKLSLYEVFIRVFLGRVLELAKKGLRSDYLELTENSNCYRGRLNIPLQVKHNAAHAARFYVTYDEYSLSRPENRIIKSTLIKLLGITDDSENAFLARSALTYFEKVQESTDFETDYQKISFDSSNQGYLGVIQWAMVFLRNKSFSIFGGGVDGQSLLFPMDRIFEQFVASQISRLISLHNKRYGSSYRFISQENKKYLFDVPKSFRIRPDLKISGNETILLDTKWKTLSSKKPNNSISQSDMYQMYAYSKRYSASEVYLLYPNTPFASFIKTKDFIANDPFISTHISIEFLNLSNIVDSLGKGLSFKENSLYSFLLKFLKTESGAFSNIATI